MTKGRPPTHSREKLLEKGIELFHQHGYHGTGLTTILQACQVSKGSFYNFFNSKEEYAVEVIEFYQALEIDRWNQEFALLEGNHFVKIRKALDHMVEELDSCRENVGCLIANLSGEIGNASPALRQAISRATSRVLGLMAEDFMICQQEGSVRTDLKPEVLAQLVWDCWQGALLRMKVEDSRAPLRQTLALLWEHILPSAAPRESDRDFNKEQLA
ncbi:Transcriptional regulator, TetR family [Nitrincola lacisaponensis]|uniref:Transcriptional regulator, TetR family n=1 Tax=Nitrincola lacisaponensis TaxID=267850 RepID=A0A063XYS4_9GAMM|nr:TetR/AcrR family transcriptional regulator [Nitrincola lacisaponensis]KDE39288.1 Transcriptional regulator, TetR family [Nitrincola lacisaponensis]